jgi:hypothetical protein
MNKLNLTNFTPVRDEIVAKYGPITALVYGAVMRYCYMEKGVCYASFETIGKSIGLSRRSVINHLKLLCDAGLIEDTTPNRKHAPHTYRLAKVPQWNLSIEPLEDSQEVSRGAGDSPLGVQEIHPRGAGDSPLGVQEIHPRGAGDSPKETMKKPCKKQSRNNHHAPAPKNEAASGHDDDVLKALLDFGFELPGAKKLIKDNLLGSPAAFAELVDQWRIAWPEIPDSEKPNMGLLYSYLRHGSRPPKISQSADWFQELQQRPPVTQLENKPPSRALSPLEAEQERARLREARRQEIEALRNHDNHENHEGVNHETHE